MTADRRKQQGDAPASQQTRKRAPTLTDVAEYCGVSIAAASWALRGDRKNVSVDTITRVREAAQLLGYDPSRHHAARRLAMRKHGREMLSHIIAVLFPPEFHEMNYYIHIFRGIMDALIPARFGLLTTCQNYGMGTELPVVFNQGEVDGLIMMGSLDSFDSVVQALREEDWFGERAIVSLMIPHPGCSVLQVDDFACGYAVGKHLLELGHRYVLQSDAVNMHANMKLRYEGLVQAYREYGLDAGQYVRDFEWHIERSADSEEKLAVLLKQHPEVTAIIAPYDLVAIQVWQFLSRQGYRLPEEMSVVGFDDTDSLADSHGQNLLTTVRLPLREAGRQAAQLLIDRITGQLSDDKVITLFGELIIRSSTASPRKREPSAS